ncbi:ImmA/IrrE family metallo-endopeptidase [Thermoanaerobacterium sp. CMT5567-10]|uniref:ImmA/IrrE family metallo-endopeptidase n=1 Tax=Thermoanaerobacterium sp. CMT5567-10 TaxID=3061989 RepID=UPI0026E021DF|nr:ImmA/IrrE family metallo-endopeptidase [Thermoanaerobacterium sp. CMT5567-10]WKV08159.1 ImmA/IrrE family metallo-endopeptidase [Thermoanaerobacterium sp. CMT5567-10]
MVNIHARVKHLIYKYGTRNPEKIARNLKMHIRYKEYNDFTKGYYINLIRNKFIIVNSLLDLNSRRIVLAHELGHALLHFNQDIYFIREYTLFPIGRFEIEANKFAAELLIDDDEIRNDWSIPEMSCWLGVPEELVKYKLGIY